LKTIKQTMANEKAINCFEMFDDDIKIKDLFNWISKESKIDFLLMVVRYRRTNGFFKVDGRGPLKTIRFLARKRLKCEFMARSWPGMRMLSPDILGRVFVFNCDSSLINDIHEIEPLLFKWHKNNTPVLPEDFSFLNSKSPFPVAITLTHDRRCLIYSKTNPTPWEHMDRGPRAPRSFKNRKDFFCDIFQ
jgi:hypothetical protein